MTRRSQSADHPRIDTRAVILLFPILALAAVLRLSGLGFGLPNIDARPDESSIAGTALGFARGGSLEPRSFNYPSLFSYVLAGAYAAGCAGARVAQIFPTVHACGEALSRRWDYLLLTARSLSAISGIGGVAAVFFIGRRLHPLGGPIASTLLAVALLHVRDSHFGVTDVAMTSMLLLALLLLLRADEQPSVGRFALAGVITGLAASTKYNAILLAVAAGVSQVRAGFFSAESSVLKYARLAVFGAALVVGFLGGTPFALISSPAFLRDVRYESSHLLQGHAVLLDVGWRYHAFVTLPQGVGWPLYVAGLAGMFWMLAVRPRAAALIFSFPLLYYFVAGRGYTVFVRYMIPVVPFLCLGAGALIAATYDWVARRRRTVAVALTATLFLVCSIPTAVKSVQFDRVLGRTDSRVLAGNWVERRVKPGASILMTGGGFAVSPNGRPPSFDVWMVEPYGDSRRVTGPARERPDWIVVEESPLRRYSYFPEPLRPVLNEYALVHTIRAINPDASLVYDQQDAFYLPLNGFRYLSRPGPNFLFYERR